MDELEEVFDGHTEFYMSEDTLDIIRREVVRGEMLKQIIDGLKPIRQLLRYQEQYLKYN